MHTESGQVREQRELAATSVAQAVSSESILPYGLHEEYGIWNTGACIILKLQGGSGFDQDSMKPSDLCQY